MKIYNIDFNGVKAAYYLYDPIIKGLVLPDWFGKNRDALWDMLTGFIEVPCVVYIRGTDNLPYELKEEVLNLISIFREAEKWHNDIGVRFKVIEEN